MPLRCVSSWLCTNVFSVHQVSAVTFYFTEEWHSISPLGILIVRTTSSSFAREAAENAASRLKNSAVWGQCHLEHRDVQEWLLAYCLEYAYAKMWKEWSNVGLQDALDWILLFAGWPWGRGRPSGSLSLGSCFHVSSCRNNDKCLEELNAKKMVKNKYAYVPRGARIFQTQKTKIWVMGSVYPRQRGLISQ